MLPHMRKGLDPGHGCMPSDVERMPPKSVKAPGFVT